MLFSSMSATVIRNSSGRIHTDVINILTWGCNNLLESENISKIK
jgi:hypothetical protein